MMNDTRGLWRGKRIDTGEWVEGLLEYRDFELSSVEIYSEKDYEDFWVDPETLGECTGLRDKNGKLIFEGDIVYFTNGHRYVVTWEDAELVLKPIGRAFETHFSIMGTCWVEGNIHDNPELMKRVDNDNE